MGTKTNKNMKKLLILFAFITLQLSAFTQIDCIVIEWNNDSTSFTVVNWDYKPAFLPVVGLTPGLEVLVKRKPYELPEYDTRLKYLQATYMVSEDFDSEHQTNRKWLEIFGLADRTIEEQIISVNEAENFANYGVFPIDKHLKYIAITLAILDKKSRGLTISTKEQSILDKVNAKALRIWNNHILGEAKKDTLNIGGLINLDDGWENVDPENE